MKRYPNLLTDTLAYLLIHLLIFIIFITGLGCGLALDLAPQLSRLISDPTPSRTWRRVGLPTLTPTPELPSEAHHPASTPTTAAQLPTQMLGPVASPTLSSHTTPVAQVNPAFSNLSPVQLSIHQQAPSATPLPRDFEPTVTSTSTNNTFHPTQTLLPTPTPTLITRLTATRLLLPTALPSPAPTPHQPNYDFLLAEFYNSPTTNSFLLVYVAVVDPNDIPIGDMKIVGTRQDHNLTYASPPTKWHYEGYNAPGEHIKSGNVKFEPPGGLESTSWVLHLEDAHGQRQSEDISFDVDENNKQWYFIKFRRKF